MTFEAFQQRFVYDPETDQLGEGGFGKVYKAYDQVRDRFVALKVAEVRKGQENFRLLNEVELANKIPEHENVAHYEACYTFAFPTGTYDFGVMQYYAEGNLGQLLQSSNLSAAEKEQLVLGLVEGVNHLHQNNIIHRDLKPGNILVIRRQNGKLVPKITDLGISKAFKDGQNTHHTNSLAGGTLNYSSPEQLQGHQTIRKNTDLWSLGVIVYRIFNGNTPFETGSYRSDSDAARADVVKRIMDAQLPADLETVPEPYRQLIRQCLVADPDQRVRSADDLRALISGKPKPATSTYVSDETVVESFKTAPTLTPDPEKPEGTSLPWPVYLVLGLVGLGLAGWFFWQKSQTEIARKDSDAVRSLFENGKITVAVSGKDTIVLGEELEFSVDVNLLESPMWDIQNPGIKHILYQFEGNDPTSLILAPEWNDSEEYVSNTFKYKPERVGELSYVFGAYLFLQDKGTLPLHAIKNVVVLPKEKPVAAVDSLSVPGTKSPATTTFGSQYVGKHSLTLQWIETDVPGKVNIKEENGVFKISGEQRYNGDFVTVNGTVEFVDKNNFWVTGTIVTKISHINNGNACKRNGRYKFRKTGGRSYFRMQSIDNPCDPVADYVDIFM
ncbi:MAG: serine/threonine protein kinase [Saprospiraceae bacterium]|nr:serine/threonine protein kinase [Saprospiraceae bacterium]